jgi:acetyl esterase/lipase
MASGAPVDPLDQLDPDMAAIAAALRDAPQTATLEPAAAREQRRTARLAAPPRPLEDVASVENITFSLDGRDVPARVYRPVGIGGAVPGVVAFHGGGFVLGTLDDYEPLCRQLANRLGAVMVSVDYRLAPEHPFPAGVDDAFDAFLAVRSQAADLGIDPRRVGVSGDSAGGNLATVVCLRAVARNVEPPVAQLLVYPEVRQSFDPEDFDPRLALPPLTIESILYFSRHTLGDPARADDPEASPLLAPNLAGLPPAVVVTAAFDILRPQIEEYIERLRRAEVPVVHLAYDKVVHGFFGQAPLVARASEAVDEAAEAFRPLLFCPEGR